MFVARLRAPRAAAFVVALATLACSAFASAVVAKDWGAKESFAVVNPVVRSECADVISLSGDWEFSTADPIFFRLAVGQGVWGSRPFPSQGRTIKVPGIWEAQGVGEPDHGRTWDCLWDCGHWDLNAAYEGGALYRKTVEIPEKWRGKRVWLKIGAVASNAWIWINRNRAAFVDTYCGARKFDVTELVEPGKTAEIVAFVRNDVPSRAGLLRVNERFGGFYRDVELEATPNLYVDDVWARGNVESKSADVRVFVKRVEPNGRAIPTYDEEISPDARDLLDDEALRPDSSPVDFDGATVDVEIQTLDGAIVGALRNAPVKLERADSGFLRAFRASVPIENCKLWTPETPNLYLANVLLKSRDGNVLHGWKERFGVRELKVVGNKFYLNGAPYFMRGGGDHNYDQINLIEPPDRDRFREHMKIYKAAGFNYLRFHTHSPLPEYFEAADEAGILLQPEAPYYHDVPCEGFDFRPKRELWELFRTNRRHVSFATYSFGNEGFLGAPLDQEMYRWVKEYDPDRLVLHQDGGVANKAGVNSDFLTCGPNGEMLIAPWKPGIADALDAPFLAHEYLNLAIKMDPRLEPRFTGVRKAPVNVAAWREKLERLGLDEKWGAACVAASEALQGIYQKQGLESARLDPACDGYMFWSLVDASIPQGSCIAAQGYLNPFWEPRPNGLAPEIFHRFNGPTALLLETSLDAPILVAGETFKASIKISHYDARVLKNPTLTWKLVDRASQRVLAQGERPLTDVEPGRAGLLDEFDVVAPDAQRPAAIEFVAQIDDVVNSWNFWLFPKREKRALDGFVVSPQLADAFAALYDDVATIPQNDADVPEDAAWIVSIDDPDFYRALNLRRKVVAIAPAAKTPNVALGWWAIGAQVGSALDPDSPCFAGFPNSNVMDELWFRLVRVGAPDLERRPLGDAFTPLFVGEGRDSYYLYLGETNFKGAKILASYALDLTAGTPEANALLDSILNYVRSDSFDPKKHTKQIVANRFVKPKDVVWGYSETVDFGEESQPWHTLYEFDVLSPTCRQIKPDEAVVWKSEPRNLDDDDESCAFAFVGALGYAGQKRDKGFELRVDGARAIVFDVPDQNAAKPGDVLQWNDQETGANLTFEVGRVGDAGQDYFGVFRLAIPRRALASDPRATFEVASRSSGSMRWFSLGQYPGLRETETLSDDRDDE